MKSALLLTLVSLVSAHALARGGGGGEVGNGGDRLPYLVASALEEAIARLDRLQPRIVKEQANDLVYSFYSENQASMIANLRAIKPEWHTGPQSSCMEEATPGSVRFSFAECGKLDYEQIIHGLIRLAANRVASSQELSNLVSGHLHRLSSGHYEGVIFSCFPEMFSHSISAVVRRNGIGLQVIVFEKSQFRISVLGVSTGEIQVLPTEEFGGAPAVKYSFAESNGLSGELTLSNLEIAPGLKRGILMLRACDRDRCGSDWLGQQLIMSCR